MVTTLPASRSDSTSSYTTESWHASGTPAVRSPLSRYPPLPPTPAYRAPPLSPAGWRGEDESAGSARTVRAATTHTAGHCPRSQPAQLPSLASASSFRMSAIRSAISACICAAYSLLRPAATIWSRKSWRSAISSAMSSRMRAICSSSVSAGGTSAAPRLGRPDSTVSRAISSGVLPANWRRIASSSLRSSAERVGAQRGALSLLYPLCSKRTSSAVLRCGTNAMGGGGS
eukprot:scaffold289510_cov30-Tisochrysis_lutea.AAC.2